MSILKPPVSDRDHAQGNRDALVTLVEYGDYQCPYCGEAYPRIKGVQLHFGRDLRFIFRNFPLMQAHPNALGAALAAEAAALQGKFWEMHDILFENQMALEKRHILAYAEKIGLDLRRFNSDIINDYLVSRVRLDFKGGVQSGVNGTPSFYIGGEKFEGINLQEAIEAELSKGRTWRAV
jgi:protein-disulfide isomerase